MAEHDTISVVDQLEKNCCKDSMPFGTLNTCRYKGHKPNVFRDGKCPWSNRGSFATTEGPRHGKTSNAAGGEREMCKRFGGNDKVYNFFSVLFW